VGEDACRDAVLGRGAEPSARELREHADVRDEPLTRHDDHIVASVAGHVGDLEIVVARVLDRIAHPRTQPAVTVVEKHADGVRAPADPGHVEAPVAVELTEANLAAVRRRETRRRSEPA
jgi:hypothetical protein